MLTVLAPVAVCVYAFPSSIINAVPLLVELPYGGVAVTGVLAGVTLGAGTLVAGLQRRFREWTAVVGAGLGTAGFAAAAAFATTGAPAWLVVAAPLLGAGGGLCLAAGLDAHRPAGRTRPARGADLAVPGLCLRRLRRAVRHGGGRPGDIGDRAVGGGRRSHRGASRCA